LLSHPHHRRHRRHCRRPRDPRCRHLETKGVDIRSPDGQTGARRLLRTRRPT
jgi:hypothetical protein